MMRLLVSIIVVMLLGVTSGPVFGAVLYGPLTFDSSNSSTQGGPYVTAGPSGGTTDFYFTSDNLTLEPTVAGHGLVHDTGFTTTLSTYAVSTDVQFSAAGNYSLGGYAIPGFGAISVELKSSLRYSVSLFDETDPKELGGGRIEEWTSGDGKNQDFFTATDQVSGDGVSSLDPLALYSMTMAINDTGDNATSTFKYTWAQEVSGVVNTWVVEETFADIRTYAVEEDTEYATHVGDLFDSIVTAARSSVGTTGFSYYVFVGPTGVGGTCTFDNTTVTDNAPAIPGDTDGDNDVDDADATTVAENWCETIAGGASVGDFNGDGVVNAIDASIMAANWTGSSETASPTAVPEPLVGTLLLSLLLCVGTLRPARKN